MAPKALQQQLRPGRAAATSIAQASPPLLQRLQGSTRGGHPCAMQGNSNGTLQGNLQGSAAHQPPTEMRILTSGLIWRSAKVWG